MPIIVAYPGVEGSFSNLAAMEATSELGECCYIGFPSFEETAQALADGKADYAILPVENSFAGAVLKTYNLLEKLPLHIVGEHIKRISHHLLGCKGAEIVNIRKISSHPQAIAQCDVFLQQLKNVQIIPSLNTAISAKEVSQSKDPSYAAIASLEAGEKYGLQVLKQNIQTSNKNYTRFLVLSQSETPLCHDLPDKATVIFTVTNQVGSLVQVLESFARSSLNMTRIESRPIPDSTFVYFFSCDFEGPMDADHLSFAMKDAARFSKNLRLLGAYKKAVMQQN